MVQQDVGQGRDVFQQAFNSALRQSGESIVGRGEDGECAFTRQGLNQASGVQGSYQGVEAAVSNSDLAIESLSSAGGRMTASITWITPLEASMSAMIT